MSQLTLFEDEPIFTNRGVKAVTFQGKLGLPIHRWYRLTPSFSPQLALDIADYFQLGPGDRVLDPFSGVGTVPLCMKYRGIPACSIELNPYLHFVSTVKTRSYRDLPALPYGQPLPSMRSRMRSMLLPATITPTRLARPAMRSLPSMRKPAGCSGPGN